MAWNLLIPTGTSFENWSWSAQYSFFDNFKFVNVLKEKEKMIQMNYDQEANEPLAYWKW